ncbi:zinc finger MYM-type protein 1-like [Hydra vulgaris]|uniref:zinc finger MYM-type protein 1-like n=1 Tax=Hydra vulgaris TaxID=6087 RepID=UPI0032EA4C9E
MLAFDDELYKPLQRNDLIISKTLPDTPYESSLWRRLTCQTLLKALDKLRAIALASQPLSNAQSFSHSSYPVSKLWSERIENCIYCLTASHLTQNGMYMYQCYIFFKFKFFKRYNIMERGKRQRLSGSQYKKIRLQREANSAKQKNALLHFLSRSSSEKALAPIVASTTNQNEVEIEIESGGEIEYADSVSVNEYRNSGNDDTAKEPENNVDDIGQNENNEDQSGEDPKTNKDLPLNFNDPAKWPIIDGKFKALLMKYGPIQKLPSLFPEDEQGATIDHINQKIIQSETQHWRQVLARIITLIRTLAGQNLALRGTCEKLFEPNNGNFLKFIEFLGNYDPIMSKHIQRITTSEIHTTYLGKTIQNEIVESLANKIKNDILAKLERAKYYSLILDCTPDISHMEQMAVVFRFVIATESSSEKPAEVVVSEHFVTFQELQDTTGANMTKVVIDKLQELGVNLDDMRGQGYDNGANMRGKYNGVQARIRQLNPRAFFVPCSAHSLNLVLNDAANCCMEAVAFFDLIQGIYNFFSASTHRWSILLNHLSDLTIKPLSATRWESRVGAVRALRFQISGVYDALIEIAEDNTLTTAPQVKSRAEAKGIARNISNFKFVCSLVLWYDILFQINIVSKMLQSQALDLSLALEHLNATKSFLCDYRCDEEFAAMVENTKKLAVELEIFEGFDVDDRVRRKSRQFLYEGRDEPIVSPEQNFRVSFFNRILDIAIQAINERFTQLSEYNELFGFLYNIGSKPLTDDELLKHCKDLHLALMSDGQSDINGVELWYEIKAIGRRLDTSNSDPKSVLKCIYTSNVVEVFPNLSIAFRILLTLPVTVASAEGSFSKLKIIKSYLRSQMCQDRLVGLATISIEKEIADHLDIEDLVKDFAELKARKIHF